MEHLPEVFARASRLAGADRSRYLDQACAGNAALRAEVESLLRDTDNSTPSVDTRAVANRVHAAAQAAERARQEAAPPLPGSIGPFRIVRVLGEGGMGTVYEADQIEPVKRKVALKVIKLGMDSREVVLRFEAERQALAVMNHPHVARMLDVGATDDGRPWFAMELVAGVALTEYCDEKRLTTRQRLELFLGAYQAVQHAHQKGVIHRDLKPGNIMVTEHEGVAELKVIDFGVAKAMGVQLTDKSLLTQVGHAIGTPAYMSPEQAEGSRLDVDTRTDVYSLGVVLYELLTGRLPFDAATTPARQWLEQLASGKTEAPTPSSRVSTLKGEEAAKVARSRGLTLHALSKELRGDLDWIVLKAMDPERSRRYETVSALATDMQRYLAEEPVEARPPTMRYRAGKFARRHRAGVAVAALLAAALASFTVLLAVQRDAARVAQAAAERETEASKRVADFLVQLFQQSDPRQTTGAEVTAKDLLDRGTERIALELKAQPLIRARLLEALGEVNISLGFYPKAEELLCEALAIRRSQLGPEHAEVAETLASLGTVLLKGTSAEAAQPFYEEALAIRRRVLGADHPDLAQSLSDLAGVNLPAERLPLLEESLAIRSEAFGREHPAVAASLEELAWARSGDLRQRGSPQEIEDIRQLYREALEIRQRSQGAEHPEVAESLRSLGELEAWMANDWQAARHYFEQAVRIQRKTLGHDHVTLVPSLIGLGQSLKQAGEMDAARGAFEDAWSIGRKQLSPEQVQVPRSLVYLCRMVADIGDLEAGWVLFREAHDPLRGGRSVIEAQEFDETTSRVTTMDYVGEALARLGLMYRDAGDLATAEQMLCEALGLRRGRDAAETRADLAGVRCRAGRTAQAEEFRRENGATAAAAVAAPP